LLGLAFRTSQYLQSLGYQIIKVKNAPTQDYEKSVIYSLKNSDPDYIQHIIEMAKVIGAEFSPIVPSWAQSTSSALVSPNADILIILGQDQKDL
ncbi:MAG: LytR C-terminal domain-containing protein, partial [Patescibacteria group bacterium]|nr:LytR C-terminal domain-containing protein [Patescibacteria group bacterium]